MSGVPTASGGDWLRLIADPVRLEIVHALAETDEATASELVGRGVSSGQTLRRHLDALVSLGLVSRRATESDGITPGRPASRFSLPDDVRSSVRLTLGIQG